MDFRGCHSPPEVIITSMRWYLRYKFSYRDVEELLAERGVRADHSTINRWVIKFSPALADAARSHKKPVGRSWRLDETYIKVKGQWKYLYRAVDSEGNTLDFLLSAKRDAQAAKRFFRKAVNASHTTAPRVINVDKNAAYPKAFAELKEEGLLPDTEPLRQNKYLNNIVEQDHRFIKRLANPGLGFGSFHTAWRTLRSCVSRATQPGLMFNVKRSHHEERKIHEECHIFVGCRVFGRQVVFGPSEHIVEVARQMQ